MTTEIFKFNRFNLCAIITENQDQHLFSANDVCAILDIKNARDAMSRLDDDERVSVKAMTNGGEQTVNAVTEAGLYRLIFRSRKPEARSLQRFVFHKVLPVLRKQGLFERLESQEITEFGKAMIRTVRGLDGKVQGGCDE